MQIVSITSQKGGVGKTTLAYNLAIAAAADGVPSILFDLDPQASAYAYHQRRLRAGGSEQPPVRSAFPKTLPDELLKAKAEGYKLVFVDTPPNVTLDALHISAVGDLVLIPVQPSMLDLDAVQVSLDITSREGRPGVVVLNRCKPNTSLDEDARALITQSFEYPVMTQTIGDRVAFVRAATQGQSVLEYEPSGKGAQEIRGVWKYVKSALKKIRAEDAANQKEVANG